MEEKQGAKSTRVGKKYQSYSVEDKIKAVSMNEAGISSTVIGRELGIDSSLIRYWSRKYRRNGIDGLRPAASRKAAYSRAVDNIKENKEISVRNGFIQYVNNPSLLRNMINSLISFGIDMGDITIGDDFCNFLKTLKQGDSVVVNSLFDISTDISVLISRIRTAFDNNISIISLEDACSTIDHEATRSEELIRILDNYVKKSEVDIEPLPEPREMHYKIPVEKYKEDSFKKAFELWSQGYSMAYATRVSGCSYNSFRHWLTKRNKRKSQMKEYSKKEQHII